MIIGLVGCGAAKRASAAPARELYTSTLFRKSLAYAVARCDKVYILSALHYLLELDRFTEPYEQTLATRDERHEWGRQVARLLIKAHGWESTFMILAGVKYAGHVAWHLIPGAGPGRGVDPDRIVQPLAGMTIGARLHFLTQAASPR